ncbi:MAG: type II secretion system GspH family protein [Muribaculaceae bacterium]|nr:type II secretion system GspH family protein [Muribaculaceae bacterium]
MKEKEMKIQGFTLAEVLITLGIIGVVAAMSIPNLIATHKAKRLRTQFLKSYSTIQQVFKQMEADDISLDPATYQAVGTFYKVFGQYLKGATDCGHGSMKLPKPCRAYQYNGNDDYKTLNSNQKFVTTWLDDGSWLKTLI